MSHRLHQPIGTVPGPALLCGVAGTAVGVVLSYLGFFSLGNQGLEAFYQSQTFALETVMPVHPYLVLGVTAATCFVLAYILLDSAFFWRRMLLGIGMLLLLAGASVALMFWSAYFNPITPMAGCIWTWLCAVIYAGQHHMPCELEAITQEIPGVPMVVAGAAAKSSEGDVDLGQDPEEPNQSVEGASETALESVVKTIEKDIQGEQPEPSVESEKSTGEESSPEAPAQQIARDVVPMPKVNKKKRRRSSGATTKQALSVEERRFMPQNAPAEHSDESATQPES